MYDIDDNILKILSITIGWIIIYFIGSFIAWDLNPMNWWLIRTNIGRIIFIILFISSVGAGFKDN